MKRFTRLYRKYNERFEFIEPIIIISVSLLFTFAILFTINNIMGEEEMVSITSNAGDAYFYEGSYDEAISEYEKLQESEEWPKWTVKIAETYSVKGDVEKSNSLLKEAILARNTLMEKEKEKYKEEDKELINDVVFTFFMNNEYEEAMLLGEDYLLNSDEYKPLYKTMVAVYMANEEVEKAKKLIEGYKVDEKSAYDIALLAKMQFVTGDYEAGYKTLSKAFETDINEVKILDVISEVAIHNRDIVIEDLMQLIELDNDNSTFKILLAKVYSMNSEELKLAEEILLGLEEKQEEGLNYNLIMADIYVNTESEEDYNKTIKKIVNKDNMTYIKYYIEAKRYIAEGKFEKAFEYCKKSILENRNYPNNYGVLMPKIMIGLEKINSIDSYFRTTITKEPFNFNNIINIGDYYGNNSVNSKKAIEYYKKSLKINPDNASVMHSIGLLELANDSLDEAIRYFRNAILINDNSSKYLRTLGTVYLDNNEPEKAIEILRSAYAIDDTDVLTLNNIAYYYIEEEGDILRGYENMKAAYEEMPENLDYESKNTIIQNYKKVEELKESYTLDDSIEIIIPQFKLFY